MRIATYNVNSVRMRLPILERWLAEASPDLVAIQETKVEDKDFPREPFEAMGYRVEVHGQKARHGVAMLSKLPITIAARGFGDGDQEDDRRLMVADVEGIRFVNSYVPNGTQVGTDKFVYKLWWMKRLRKFLDETCDKGHPLVWLGDVNVAPTADDLHDAKRNYGKVGHHPDEFAALADVTGWGLTDVYRRFHEGPGHYTFWDYRLPKAVERGLGWRIDHIYANDAILNRFTAARVDVWPRLEEKPSDHAPVVADLDWP
ncbi:MAG: Exodeoxyribonuclease III [Fimbriimonadales bacterium]|nr:MAG: exodeoxyribonuclease III [Armatimonadota bacterium]MBV6504435.1 Exodeoxyribonuclease III [Fimbriimonadales bacterium]MCE7900990.1 exodeoxyribonuclease III [Armatimonadetes bacterium ATM1]MDL1929584.1 exodeoxyribonuclease III [Fimbriimonadia bacterium ATM]MBC6970856.1 exodeoxyribonuclease III [Armatimonadota bacterium]